MPSLMSQLALVALAGAMLTTNTYAARLPARATTCNGHAELCEKSYGAVSFVGAHNSYAVGVNNAAANQDHDITTQLNDGVRLLQVQAHDKQGEIHLCHSDCRLLDAGTFLDYLGKLKSWMDSHPEEVITVLVVNINNLPVSRFAEIYTSAGLDTVSFAPEAAVIQAASWPTLGSMIDSGKRLVTFLDNQADFASVPWIIDEFTNVWETAFGVTDPAGFDCTVNRTKGDTATQLYLINHFLDKPFLGVTAPDIDKANVTNAASGPGSLGAHVETCEAVNTRPPNFLLVDYYEFGGGSVFEVAASINGVPYTPSPTLAKPLSPNASGGSNNTSPGGGSGNNALGLNVAWSRVFGVLTGIALGSWVVL